MEFKETEHRACNGEWLITGDTMPEKKTREMEERQ